MGDDLSKELDLLAEKKTQVTLGPTSNEGVFRDKTSQYGLLGNSAVALNAIDLNFDGSSDLVILPSYFSRPKFFIWEKKLNKFILWEHDPLPSDFKASFLLFYDFNKDEVPDLISGVLNQKSEVGQIPLKLFMGKINNKKLYFREKLNAIPLSAAPTSSVSVLDYDLDGHLDLFISNWFQNQQGQFLPVADRLLRFVGGKFVDVSDLLKGETVKAADQLYPPGARPTYGASTCDIDQNGYPDILTISSSGYANKLWMAQKDTRTGDVSYVDVGRESNYASDTLGSLIPTGGGRSFFSACADYNNDSLMDIFLGELSHAYDNDSADRSSILTGSKETYPPFFIRTEYLSDTTTESWNQGDRRGVWLDYNMDGLIDLVVDNSGFPPHSRLVLFEQDKTHAFFNVASRVGVDIVNPTATITMDQNKDGLPDLVTSQNNIRNAQIVPRIYFFENSLPYGGKKTIKIHLHGIKSNREGIGAMVMLYTKVKEKKIIQRRWVEYSQGGLPSQNEEGLLFGVPARTKIIGVKVRWPYLQKKGINSSEVLEKLYSLSHFSFQNYLEVTLCEDGKVLIGKMSCGQH